MISNNLPLESLNVQSARHHRKLLTSTAFWHSRWHVKNLVADSISGVLISLFTDFYSPLKHYAVK